MQVRALGAGALSLERRLKGLACQSFVADRVLEDAVAASSRPPDAILRGRRRQTEPAFASALASQFFLLRQVDERKLMTVIAVGADEHPAVVRQGKDVERQVGELDVMAGRSQDPAIGQHEALLTGAGRLRRCA